jgi:hypothetical protein
MQRSRHWLKKGIATMQQNKSLGRIRFRRAVSPHSEDNPAGTIEALVPVQVTAKPISQTHYRLGDSR